MKKIYSYLLLLIIILMLTEACGGKGGEPKPHNAGVSTKVGLLKNTWQINKVTQAGNPIPLYQKPLPIGQAIIEDYSQCHLSFTSGTDYTIKEKDGSIRSGKWELVSNETKIIFDKGLDKEVIVEIVEINSISLKLRYTEVSLKTGIRELQIDYIL